MNEPRTQELEGYDLSLSDEDLAAKAIEFLKISQRRRSVRAFSKRPVPRDVIELCISVAGAAPSGANQQPWHFAAVSSSSVKREIRVAAESEEAEFYQNRAPQAWLDALAPIGTDQHKPFLETAPWLIAVFAETYGIDAEDDQSTRKHYYVNESVGIACGGLIGALNYCGLATLTHTPSPMRFLNSILGRPQNEKPYLLLVVGFPATSCRVPVLEKKTLPQIASFFE